MRNASEKGSERASEKTTEKANEKLPSLSLASWRILRTEYSAAYPGSSSSASLFTIFRFNMLCSMKYGRLTEIRVSSSWHIQLGF